MSNIDQELPAITPQEALYWLPGKDCFTLDTRTYLARMRGMPGYEASRELGRASTEEEIVFKALGIMTNDGAQHYLTPFGYEVAAAADFSLLFDAG